MLSIHTVNFRAHITTFCDYNMPNGGAKFTKGGLLFIEKWGALRHAMNIGLETPNL